jgi:putative spermidine/putrescine transport system ATP-binding protein
MSSTPSRAAALPITIRQVAKTYGSVHALDHVDLDVKSGEFLTLLGPSGSGKTTLLMVLAGFTRPDSGSVKFGDDEVIRLPPHKRDVGMVFQNYALFPHMDVAANIAFPLRLRKVAPADIARRVEAALETVQLGGYGKRRIDQLSGGQRQRIALARAIVFEPRILLMDEPLSALDKQLREHMQIELRELHDKLGMTTIYVTHDQREALTMSDRIAVIQHGRVMQLDTPRRIYEAPANRFVAGFIGESTFVPVERVNGIVCAQADGGEGAVLEQPQSGDGVGHGAGNSARPKAKYRCAGRTLTCAAPVIPAASSVVPATRADTRGSGLPAFTSAGTPPSSTAELVLLLRPERVHILTGPASAGINELDGEVEDIIYQGDTFLVHVRLLDGSTTQGARIGVRGIASGLALSAAPARGTRVRLGIAVDDTVVLPAG